MRRGAAPPVLDGPPTDTYSGAGATSPVMAPGEYRFVLPRGYLDDNGTVHREGVMRLATARDELLPLLDARVQAHSAFLSIVLLGRVVTRLGTLPMVNADVIEHMYATDVAFLQDIYRRINTEGHTTAAVTCPTCSSEFTVDTAGGRLGES